MIPRALGHAKGKADFYIASEQLSMFDGLRDTRRVAVNKSVTVEVSTLDVEWMALGRPAVSVIKCDVEGNEWPILQGAESLLGESAAVCSAGMERE